MYAAPVQMVIIRHHRTMPGRCAFRPARLSWNRQVELHAAYCVQTDGFGKASP